MCGFGQMMALQPSFPSPPPAAKLCVDIIELQFIRSTFLSSRSGRSGGSLADLKARPASERTTFTSTSRKTDSLGTLFDGGMTFDFGAGQQLMAGHESMDGTQSWFHSGPGPVAGVGVGVGVGAGAGAGAGAGTSASTWTGAGKSAGAG